MEITPEEKKKTVIRRQKYIIQGLGILGLFFLLAGLGGGLEEQTNKGIILGGGMVLASLINLIFYKKRISGQVKHYEENPGSFERDNRIIKFISRFLSLRNICYMSFVILLGVYIFIKTNGIAGVGYFVIIIILLLLEIRSFRRNK